MTAAKARDDSFDRLLTDFGHTYELDKDEVTQVEIATNVNNITFAEATPIGGANPAKKLKVAEKLMVRNLNTDRDLDDLMSEEASITKDISKDGITWLNKLYKSTRGYELGTSDDAILASAMNAQSAKWEPLALSYVCDIIIMAHEFILCLLHIVCKEERARNALLSLMLDDLRALYQNAVEKVHERLDIERGGTLTTTNHYYNDILQKKYVKISFVRLVLFLTKSY